MASTLKHLRSSTADKRPTASGLVDGQLAINTASGTPALFFKDSNGGVVKVGPAHVGGSAPNATPAGSAGNSLGELWVDNSLTTPGLNYYTGSAFVNLTPSGTTTTVGLVELATPAETQTGTDAVRAVTPSGLQSKVSDSTSTTSSTTIASSTAVKSAYDLANAALPKAGGTVTGELLIGNTGSLVFEGSTDDSFETTIAVVDPTADRTITFPNVTGTVVTTGDSGTVTSTMIANDTIVNADINSAAAIAYSKLALSSGIVNTDISASAAIVDTKLATISTADKVSISALNIDGATDIGGALENGDLFIVDDGAGGTNRKAPAFRLSQLTYSGVTGDITIASGGTSAISAGVIVNADVNASAAIDFSKLASLTSANILIGNASNIATSTAVTGDVTISNAGVTAIAAGAIVDADISASAEIAVSKLADGTARQLLQTDAAGTGVEWASNIDIPGTLDVTSAATFDSTIGASAGTASLPSITFTGDLNTGIYSPGADQVAISTNGTGKLFVDSSGNVGVNTAATIAPAGFGYAREFAITGATSGDSSTAINIRGSRTVAGGFGDINFWHQSTSNRAYIQARRGSSDSAIDLDFITSGGAGMRITSTGAVGLGTSTPSGKLESAGVTGTTLIRAVGQDTNGTADVEIFSTGTTGQSRLYFSDTAAQSGRIIYNHSTNAFTVSTNATAAVTIDSSQRVGVGTTSPNTALEVAVTGNNGARISNSGNAGSDYAVLDFVQAFNQKGVFYTNNNNLVINATAGNLIFQEGSAEAARIDSSGRLGIGSSTVAGRLQVGTTSISDNNALVFNRGIKPSIAATQTAILCEGNGIASGECLTFMSDQGYKFLDDTGATEWMRLTATGLGIGTNSVASILHTSGSSDQAVTIQTTTAGADTRINFRNSAGTDAGGIQYLHNGNHLLFNANSGERARIDGSGRLLVGTSSTRTIAFWDTPHFLFEGTDYQKSSLCLYNNQNEIYGAVLSLGHSRGTSVGSNTVLQNNDYTGVIAFYGSDGSNEIRAAEIAAYVDGTPGTNDMPGRLVFSTTADGASSPTERMRISAEGGMRIFGSPGGVTQYINSNRPAGTSDFLIYGQHSATSTTTGTLSFSVATNGNVQNTNNSYGAISDIKLKENIVNANSQWDDLKALQVRNYNFKEGQTHTQIGLIAQEVELVSPGLVSESPDRDEEGNDLGTVTKSVNYSVLYMKAVKALQEAMERIETLEAKVAALEAR